MKVSDVMVWQFRDGMGILDPAKDEKNFKRKIDDDMRFRAWAKHIVKCFNSASNGKMVTIKAMGVTTKKVMDIRNRQAKMCMGVFKKSGMSQAMIESLTVSENDIQDSVQYLAEWARSERDRKEMEKDMHKRKAPIRRTWDRCMV